MGGKRVYVIGLTGGIASGKSTVARLLRELGAPVVDADVLAREAVCPGEAAWKAIVARYGEKILLSDGALDRAKVGEIIFGDPAEKAWLDAAMHPILRARAEASLEALRSGGACVAVLDVPLLFEAGWQPLADEVWVVCVRREVQVERLMRRNGLARRQALARIASQMDLAEKARRADFVVDNNGDFASAKAQVACRWQKVMDRWGRKTHDFHG